MEILKAAGAIDQRFFFDAVAAGNVIETSRLIASDDIDIHSRDDRNFGASAIYLAAAEGHLDVLRLLIENEVNINTPNWVSN